MPPLKMPKSTRNFILITLFFVGLYAFVRSLPTQSCELAYYGDYLNPDGSLGFCGDEEVHFFDLDQLQYPFSVHLQQDVSLKAGTKQSLRMQFTGPDGQPVRPEDLIVSHTERLHLLAVSEDLSDYQHLHPQATGVPGEYRFDWQPLRAGDYRLYFDFIVQASLRRALVDTQVTVAGRPQSDTAAQTRAVNLQAQTEQYAFELQADRAEFRANETVYFDLVVTHRQTGAQVELQEVMGALAHLVAFDSQRNGFAHMHPLQPYLPEQAQPDRIPFAFNAIVAGHYRIWAQVQIDGQPVFVPFDLPIHS